LIGSGEIFAGLPGLRGMQCEYSARAFSEQVRGWRVSGIFCPIDLNRSGILRSGY
jgi:hypothetical protein